MHSLCHCATAAPPPPRRATNLSVCRPFTVLPFSPSWSDLPSIIVAQAAECGAARKSPKSLMAESISCYSGASFHISHCLSHSEMVESPSDGVVVASPVAGAAAGGGFLRSSSPLSIDRFEWRTRWSSINRHRDSPSF